jgi:7,8-dihydroneopterin aldolase/epimerase/oxygenase
MSASQAPEPAVSRVPSSVTIFVRGASVETTIGVYPHERRGRRTILMDLEIETASGNRAGLTDRLADTIDYSAVVDRVRLRLANERYSLLERVAECIAALILLEFRAHKVCISLFKTDVVEQVRSVGVKIQRTRSRLAALHEPARPVTGHDATGLPNHRQPAGGRDVPQDGGA